MNADEVVAAIAARDWPRLRALLHPYLHWTCDDARTIRGRTNVLAYLAASERPVEAPVAHEWRDGQVYRWTEPSRGDLPFGGPDR